MSDDSHKEKREAESNQEKQETESNPEKREAEPAQEKQETEKKKAASAKAKAAARAKKKDKKPRKREEEKKPKPPSVNQPLLDHFVQVITDNVGQEVIEEHYINDVAKEVPTLVIRNEHWYTVAQFLKHNEQLAFDYLSGLHGTDFESHMEVYFYFYSYQHRHSLAVRVKTDRESAAMASVTPIWSGANWPEREVYDLLGIEFTGHPDLRRIMMADDWVGHPLRKDYEQYDEEV